MTHRRLLKAVAVVALLLIIGGFALAVYFGFWFDSWVPVDASAPPGVEANGFSETVFYQNAELAEQAKTGSRLGVVLLLVGLVLSLWSLMTLARRKRDPVESDGQA